MYLKIKVEILHWIIYMYIRAFTILAFSITAFEIDIKIKDILFTIYFFIHDIPKVHKYGFKYDVINCDTPSGI